MPRILKNIRIDEVSAVTKGAGEGTRIVLMKRDTSADNFDEWHRQQARIADEQNELHLRKHARNWRSFDEVLAENVAKSAKGDEAEGLIAEPKPVDDAIADSVDRRRDGIAFDVGNTRLKFPNERALAVWLAVQERIRKSNKEDTTMTQTTEELDAERTAKLDEVVKAYGIMPLAKQMIAEGSSYGIAEAEFTKLATAHAQRLYPDMSPAAAFEKLYSDGSEDGVILREAHSIAKAATLTPIVVDGNVNDPDDASEATQALSRLVEEQRARAPWMSAEQLYEKIMRENQELTAKAFRRPAPTTTYPFPR
jgi:hypothetical protein